MVSRNLRYRRSPCIVTCWSGSQLIFENYATRKRVAAAPLTCEVLDWFSNWRSIEEVSREVKQYDAASLATSIRQLASVTLLQRSDRKPHPVEAQIARWKDWNPGAGFFHFASKDVALRGDPAERRAYFTDLAKQSAMPSSVKHYPDAPQVRLSKGSHDGDFSRSLLARRTWRRFSRSPIPVDQLAALLWLTFRIHGWLDFYGLGKLAIKTSPSGGARHPIEAYIAALNVRGLKRGLYHYAADKHVLEYLDTAPSRVVLHSLTPTQDWCSEAAAMVFMTAVFGRSQWKYRFPRAYRVVLADAGHIGQTFCLAATHLGLAPYCTMAFADSKIERLLGIDGVAEGIIYLAGVGLPAQGHSPADALVIGEAMDSG